MIFNKEILITMIILFVVNIVIWFQLNGQLRWDWWKDNVWFVCLLGMPIGYLLYLSTKFGYSGFEALWPVRMLGFATSMITFPLITWFVLGEGITLKTGISLGLSVILILLQLI